MKLFLTATALLAPMGHAQTAPAPAPATEPKDGQTKCEEAMNRPNGLCEYYEYCNVPEGNRSFTQCLPKGNTACYLYKDLGDEGDIRDANPFGCFPYQTCCDGACCGPNQQCMEVVGTPAVNPYQPYAFKYGDETIDDINKVARNDWTTDKGRKIERKPRICVDHTETPVMSVSTAMKAIYMPILGLGVTFLFFIVAIAKRQKSIPSMLFELAVIASSFFLILTEGWLMSLLCVFVAAASAASGDRDKKWIVWFQLFFLWVYFGGASYFMFAQAPTNFFDKATKPAVTIDSLSQSCSNYFDYYKRNPKQLLWSENPSDLYTGLCAHAFLGYQVFMAYLQAISMFLMSITTVVSYLNPGNKSSEPETANPTVEMGA